MATALHVALGTTVHHHGVKNNTLDGIGAYTSGLIRGLESVGNLNTSTFAFDLRETELAQSAIRAGNYRRQAILASLSGAEFSTLSRALDVDVGLLHATDHLVPKLRGTPVVATLMDAIPLAHPEWVSYPLKTITNHFWKHSFGWADHVITISNFSKQEIIKWFEVPETRISVVPLAPGISLNISPHTAASNSVLERYGLNRGYILSVGTLQPRKNYERLLNAHQQLPAKQQKEMPLVIVGREGWGCESLCKRLVGADPERVRWLSRVTEEELTAILVEARAMVIPSLYEGFGLPILEAFNAGVPVLASNATAIPEVTGDAALLFDPTNIDEIAACMELIYESPAYSARLSETGRQRALKFSWKRTAVETSQVYSKLIG